MDKKFALFYIVNSSTAGEILNKAKEKYDELIDPGFGVFSRLPQGIGLVSSALLCAINKRAPRQNMEDFVLLMRILVAIVLHGDKENFNEAVLCESVRVSPFLSYLLDQDLLSPHAKSLKFQESREFLRTSLLNEKYNKHYNKKKIIIDNLIDYIKELGIRPSRVPNFDMGLKEGDSSGQRGIYYHQHFIPCGPFIYGVFTRENPSNLYRCDKEAKLSAQIDMQNYVRKTSACPVSRYTSSISDAAKKYKVVTNLRQAFYNLDLSQKMNGADKAAHETFSLISANSKFDINKYSTLVNNCKKIIKFLANGEKIKSHLQRLEFEFSTFLRKNSISAANARIGHLSQALDNELAKMDLEPNAASHLANALLHQDFIYVMQWILISYEEKSNPNFLEKNISKIILFLNSDAAKFMSFQADTMNIKDFIFNLAGANCHAQDFRYPERLFRHLTTSMNAGSFICLSTALSPENQCGPHFLRLSDLPALHAMDIGGPTRRLNMRSTLAVA